MAGSGNAKQGNRPKGAAAQATSAETIERERKVLELRRAGVTFDVIAEQTGYSDRGGAHKAYKSALARTLQQPAAEIRELELDRLDRLHFAAWSKAMAGDLQAIDRCIRIAERRAKILGLDAPVQHRVGVTDAITAEIERLAAELAGTPGQAPPRSAADTP